MYWHVGERSRHGSGGLVVGDVLVREDMVHLWIRKFKTDQVGQGAHIEFGEVPQATACPVSPLHEWIMGSA